MTQTQRIETNLAAHKVLTDKLIATGVDRKIASAAALKQLEQMPKSVRRAYAEEAKLPSVKPMREIDGVEVYNVCDLIDFSTDLNYEAECAKVDQFCKKYDAAYYAAPREDFSHYNAVRKARAEGKTRVVVEDLS